MNVDAQLQPRGATQRRGKARLLVDMPSKRRPTWDKETIRVRMRDARIKRLDITVEDAAAAAGMGYWSWYKKEAGDVAFAPEECIRFGATKGCPTLFPFYDWTHAEELDERLGWDK